ncbi:MAG: hypothetical protein HPY54_10915 [Chthonomonadetes bacterium]|jgi:hypothetical protein|nr:hypothetical protein [Chthonomonadetes bacterium]
MPKGRLMNDLDLYGAIAVLAFYLKWASGQIVSGERSITEVHLALTGALLVGLAYRFFWQKVSPKVAEPISRVLLLLAGVLVQGRWVAESVMLVACANLWWLLWGARLKRLQRHASLQTIAALYVLLLFLPRDSGVVWLIGLIILLTAMGTPVYARTQEENPYPAVAVVGGLLVAVVGGVWLLVAPTAETPAQQLGQRLMAGFGVSLLLIAGLMLLREWRSGAWGR